MRWMHLQLRAPLAAFGGVAIDARGVTRDFPAQSMLVGLFANALGWRRSMREQHQTLQDRLVFGALNEHRPERMTDYQIATLYQDDRSWNTDGNPIGRDRSQIYSEDRTGARSLKYPQWRDYCVDLSTSVVVRLEPAEQAPTLDEIAAALERPVRPLFIGRKPCLPSAPIFGGWVTAPDARAALVAVAPAGAGGQPAVWPAIDGAAGDAEADEVADERNWISGLHGGARRVCRGLLSGQGREE